ncbi:MAG: ribosome biogenesis GTP-binding protein YihA/YsxC, partial [Bacteroidales bacterium]
CVFLLIDSRLEPQKIDMDFVEWLGENGIPFCIVLTKLDKISKGQKSANRLKLEEKLLQTWEELPLIFETSSEKKVGKEELLNYIDEINKQL